VIGVELRQTDQSGEHRGHDGVLDCCAAQASASFDTPQAIIVTTPYRDVVRVVWHDHAPDLSRFRAGSNAQARAALDVNFRPRPSRIHNSIVAEISMSIRLLRAACRARIALVP